MIKAIATAIVVLLGALLIMDSMVGKDFEAGLANLKAITESQPR